MNLVCDESVERPVVERLRAEGHAVVARYVMETRRRPTRSGRRW